MVPALEAAFGHTGHFLSFQFSILSLGSPRKAGRATSTWICHYARTSWRKPRHATSDPNRLDCGEQVPA
jgi:hypothetical protein